MMRSSPIATTKKWRTVDAVERLFLKQTSKAVFGSGFLQDLHEHDVLVDLHCRGRQISVDHLGWFSSFGWMAG